MIIISLESLYNIIYQSSQSLYQWFNELLGSNLNQVDIYQLAITLFKSYKSYYININNYEEKYLINQLIIDLNQYQDCKTLDDISNFIMNSNINLFQYIKESRQRIFKLTGAGMIKTYITSIESYFDQYIIKILILYIFISTILFNNKEPLITSKDNNVTSSSSSSSSYMTQYLSNAFDIIYKIKLLYNKLIKFEEETASLILKNTIIIKIF